jgi:hypothetical protein
MSPLSLARRLLPWLACALAVIALGYTWRWALVKSSERQRLHHAFSTGSTAFIFNLCPSTSLAEAPPPWARDMRARCVVGQPAWGTVEPGSARPELEVEKGSTWESLQLLSRLVLEISPGKLLSLLSLVVISLAGTLGLQRRGWLERQGLHRRITRGTALVMLTIVLVAVSLSLVLLDEKETLSLCEITGNTYANLLSVDARCSQQTMLLHDTQARLEKTRSELESRAQELEKLQREISSLGAMRDALGSFKTELQSQNESTQQLIRAVTGVTLEGLNKALDPLHADVKGLDTMLKTDLREDLRTLVRTELQEALQGEALQALIRRQVGAAVREDMGELVRGELRDSVKRALAERPAAPPPVPAPASVVPKPEPKPAPSLAVSKTVAPARKPTPPPAAPGKR